MRDQCKRRHSRAEQLRLRERNGAQILIHSIPDYQHTTTPTSGRYPQACEDSLRASWMTKEYPYLMGIKNPAHLPGFSLGTFFAATRLPSGLCGLCGVESIRFSAASRRSMVSSLL